MTSDRGTGIQPPSRFWGRIKLLCHLETISQIASAGTTILRRRENRERMRCIKKSFIFFAAKPQTQLNYVPANKTKFSLFGMKWSFYSNNRPLPVYSLAAWCTKTLLPIAELSQPTLVTRTFTFLPVPSAT